MHSIRMRTVRNSSRLRGGVPGPGGCTLSGVGVPGPTGVYPPGGVPTQGVYLVPGDVPAQGVYLVPGGCTCQGVPGPGGCTCWGCIWSWGDVPGLGVYLVWECTWSRGCTCLGGVPGLRGYLPRYSPPVNRMTDRCKNITFATSLRTVNI